MFLKEFYIYMWRWHPPLIKEGANLLTLIIAGSQSSLTRQSYSVVLLVGIDGWVNELTVVVLGVKVFLDGVGNLEEVGHVD